MMRQKDRKKALKRYEKMLSGLEELNNILKEPCVYCEKTGVCHLCPLQFNVNKGISACNDLRHPWAEIVINTTRMKKNLLLIINTTKKDITLSKAQNIRKKRENNE